MASQVRNTSSHLYHSTINDLIDDDDKESLSELWVDDQTEQQRRIQNLLQAGKRTSILVDKKKSEGVSMNDLISSSWQSRIAVVSKKNSDLLCRGVTLSQAPERLLESRNVSSDLSQIKHNDKGLRINTSEEGTSHIDSRDANDYESIEKEIKELTSRATSHIEKKDYYSALDIFDSLLKLQISMVGTIHPSIASAYHNIGIVNVKCANKSSHHNNKEDYRSTALESFRRAAQIAREVLGVSHPNVALSLVRIGVLLLDYGQYLNALIAFREALRIRKTVYGQSHGLVAKVYNNLGVANLHLGKYEESLHSFQKCLDIQRGIFSTFSRDGYTDKDDRRSLKQSQIQSIMADTLCNIGSLCIDWIDRGKCFLDITEREELAIRAERSFAEALEIRSDFLSHNHTQVHVTEKLFYDAKTYSDVLRKEIRDLKSRDRPSQRNMSRTLSRSSSVCFAPQIISQDMERGEKNSNISVIQSNSTNFLTMNDSLEKSAFVELESADVDCEESCMIWDHQLGYSSSFKSFPWDEKSMSGFVLSSELEVPERKLTIVSPVLVSRRNVSISSSTDESRSRILHDLDSLEIDCTSHSRLLSNGSKHDAFLNPKETFSENTNSTFVQALKDSEDSSALPVDIVFGEESGRPIVLPTINDEEKSKAIYSNKEDHETNSPDPRIIRKGSMNEKSVFLMNESSRGIRNSRHEYIDDEDEINVVEDSVKYYETDAMIEDDVLLSCPEQYSKQIEKRATQLLKVSKSSIFDIG